MRNKQLKQIQTHTDMAYNGAYNSNGVVEQVVPVPNDSVGFIIGAKGKTVNLIKRNTGAWVQVQTNGSKSSFLVRGFPHQVQEAVSWINTIVEEAGHRGPPPAPECSSRSLTSHRFRVRRARFLRHRRRLDSRRRLRCRLDSRCRLRCRLDSRRGSSPHWGCPRWDMFLHLSWLPIRSGCMTRWDVRSSTQFLGT